MTGVFNVMVNVFAFGMTAVEAVSAPRFDCQSDTLDGERRIPSWVLEGAADRAGLKLWNNPAAAPTFVPLKTRSQIVGMQNAMPPTNARNDTWMLFTNTFVLNAAAASDE